MLRSEEREGWVQAANTGGIFVWGTGSKREELTFSRVAEEWGTL